MPNKRLKQTIHSLCSPLNVPQQQNNLLGLPLSSMNKQCSHYNPLNIKLCSTTAKELAQFTVQLYHYSLKLHVEIYNPTFKTLPGSSNVSESWKEMTRKSKENSSANAVKWWQSAKRVEWAFPHGQHTPSPDFCARSVHTVFHNHAI